MTSDVQFDWDRGTRTLVPEAVFCEGKSIVQLLSILDEASQRQTPLLLTRLSEAFAEELNNARQLDYDPISRTAILGEPKPASLIGQVAIAAAGSTDMPVALEAQRALAFFGAEAPIFADIGVAGLWRLQEAAPALAKHRVIIAVAGMEGALFSVLAGLVPSLVIAAPSPVGYGVAEGGHAALSSALSSCAPGVLTVNIGNGFGAAAAAWKIISPRRS